MNNPPPEAHSFVVKVWAKEVEDPNADTTWRGQVTHVGSGERQYVESLMDISGVLAPHVHELGGTLDPFTRLFLLLSELEGPANR